MLRQVQTVMRIFLAICLLINFSLTGYAQKDKNAAEQTVEHFFNGLNANDTALIKSTLYEDVELATVVKGSRPVKVESVDHFLESVHKSREMDLEERITSYEVMMDEGMAIVWAPYRFFVNGQLSHCGVNAFTLILTDQGWKIHRIIDTRRRENCHPEE